jgi:hypothetical protein
MSINSIGDLEIKNFEKVIPRWLFDYLVIKKKNKQFELSELVFTLCLNKRFIDELFRVIQHSNIEKPITKGGEVSFGVNIAMPTEALEIFMENILGSLYFKKNFSEYERLRKKELLENIIFEISSAYALKEVFNASVNYIPIKYPLISHETTGPNFISLSFPQGTPKEEINKYLDDNNLVSRRKKPKNDIGRDFLILHIKENDIHDYKFKQKHAYLYGKIKEIYRDKYKIKKHLTDELIKKALYRIQKVRQQINQSKMDK